VTETIRLRRMDSADIAGGLRLCRASGWNQLEEDWRGVIDSPGGAWLAEKDGRVVGTAALMRYDSLAWVAMMLVDPGERRAGLGARLLEAALAAAEDAGCVGLDATPAGEPLYHKYGFETSYSLERLKAAVDGARFAGSPGVARPMTVGDIPAVCRMDREVFGADRGSLLASLFRRAPECAWIVEGRGYCFGRPGFLYAQLGPVVANDPATARDLTASCLARMGGGVVVMDVPLFDKGWLAWLESSGFVEERPFARMFLRGHQHPGVPPRQYAICGPEFA
jgi:GNAT superfamily N-acetyltransferase